MMAVKKQSKIIIGIILIVMALTGGLYLASGRLISGGIVESLQKQNGIEGNSEDGSESKEEQEKEEIEGKKDLEDSIPEAKGDITFLVIGVDDGERSDTLMLCKYFSDTGKISVLSIPRDSRAFIPGYGMDKINHAHAYKGPELSMEAVSNLLGVDVDYYLRVDYKLVEEIVDTVGGVEVDVPDSIYEIEGGLRTLSGEEALVYLRYRAGYANQDLGRIEAQQQFLKGMIAKMADTRNVGQISSMIKSGIDNVDTNIPTRKILSYTLKLKGIDAENIQMETLPGTPAMIDRVSYILVDEDEIPNIVEELFIKSEI